jgi:hypothetical protein
MGGQEPPIQLAGDIDLDGRVLPGHGEQEEMTLREHLFGDAFGKFTAAARRRP